MCIFSNVQTSKIFCTLSINCFFIFSSIFIRMHIRYRIYYNNGALIGDIVVSMIVIDAFRCFFFICNSHAFESLKYLKIISGFIHFWVFELFISFVDFHSTFFENRLIYVNLRNLAWSTSRYISHSFFFWSITKKIDPVENYFFVHFDFISHKLLFYFILIVSHYIYHSFGLCHLWSLYSYHDSWNQP